jgi:hypothetical protein
MAPFASFFSFFLERHHLLLIRCTCTTTVPLPAGRESLFKSGGMQPKTSQKQSPLTFLSLPKLHRQSHMRPSVVENYL